MGAPCRDLGQGHHQLLQPTLDETTVYKFSNRSCLPERGTGLTLRVSVSFASHLKELST